MWQKARIINAPVSKHLIGREIWVQPPRESSGFTPEGHFVSSARGCRTNYININGQRLAFNVKYLEFLPEFKDDIPLEPVPHDLLT